MRPNLLPLAVLLSVLGVSMAMGAGPASKARLDLLAEPGTGLLESGRILEGSGYTMRRSWIKDPAEWNRGYLLEVPVVAFQWSRFAFEFVPQSNGLLTITLSGQWDPDASGKLRRLETWWDAVRVDGAEVANGSFELELGGERGGWTAGGSGRVESPGSAAAVPDGTRVARTWHDGPLRQTVRVRGGVKVRVSGSVRAAPPEGWKDMKRLGRDTPAHRALDRYRRGINLSNYLQAPPNTWGVLRYSDADFQAMKAAGFDHVRIPVGWSYWASKDEAATIDPKLYPDVDQLVHGALKAGLNVVLNHHDFDDLVKDPAANSNRFYNVWRQIAERYRNEPDTVAFELLNEPHAALTTEIVSELYPHCIRVIRETNPRRIVMVGTGSWNAFGELPRLRLPDDDDRIIVTLHTYEPFNFTHQSAPWAGDEVSKLKGVVFPGPPAQPMTAPEGVGSVMRQWIESYNTEPTALNPCAPGVFLPNFDLAKAWSDYYGRPVHVGEFGAMKVADPASRVNYYGTIRRELEKRGMGWAIWDWKAYFALMKEVEPGRFEEVSPGMREALLGK